MLFILCLVLGQNLISQTNSSIPSQLSVKNKLNFIQFQDATLFNQVVNGFNSARSTGYSIVHFGDSHIQAEGPTSVARKNLQALYGDAGRGMMFAYSAANSYSSILYGTSHTGNWTYAKSFQSAPKLPLGVSGMTVRTDEKNASLIFTLKQPNTSYQKLRIFLKKDSSSFDFKILTADDQISLNIKDYLSTKLPYIEVPITGNQSKITIQLVQNSPSQNFFEFYGMSLETAQNKGVIYHSVGVGASQYGSLLLEELLDDQLPSLNPSLLILDFGTNNYLYDDKVKPELGPQIEEIITKLRSYSPKATILLTSTQDLYYKSKHVTSGIIFRNLIDSLAKKNNCLFWDWYAVSGGKKSLVKWRDAGYAQTDLVHLTTKGYELKGQLLFDAIKNSMDSLSKNSALQSLSIPYSEQREIVVEIVPEKKVEEKKVEEKKVEPKKPEVKPQTPKKDTNKKPSTKVHIVKKGDTLYGIAAKYKTTVAQLKKSNKLKSENLQIGQKLIIP
ncbi:MAG: LysM peptidoglycan-binding domain-containing protein [Bacteroidota bacterium]